MNVALAHRGKPVLGVIGIPVSGEFYYAVKGEGAFMKRMAIHKKINVSSRVEDIRMVVSRSHKSDKLASLIERNGIKCLNRRQRHQGRMIAKGKPGILGSDAMDG